MSTEKKEKALLSCTECEKILANIVACHDGKERVKDVQLQAYRLEIMPEAVGFLGDYYHLKLICTDAGGGGGDNDNKNEHERIITAFVKSKTRRYADTEASDIFKKETDIYSTLLKDIEKYSRVQWAPKFYYARDDLLVIQDLEGYNYSLCSKQDLSYIEMRMVIRSLSALHTASIAYEVKAGINIGEKYAEYLREFSVTPQTAWFLTGLRTILAIIKNHAKYQSIACQEFIEEKLEKRLEIIYSMVDTSTKYRNVLCHRDVWYANIFFLNSAKYYHERPTVSLQVEDDTSYDPAILVDYQTCRYCPAAIDLVLFIYMHLSRQEREDREMEYLMLYCRIFIADMAQQNLVADDYISVEEFLKSYREFKVLGCLYKAIAFTIIRVPKEFVTNEYKLVNRTDRVIEYMEDNEIFCMYMEECIEDLMAELLTEEEKQIFSID